MLEVYPQLKDVKIDYGWGGTLAITMNRMPFFEKLDDNVFTATGYSGHGVAMATLAGQIMADAVAGTVERFDVMANIKTPVFPGARCCVSRCWWPPCCGIRSATSFKVPALIPTGNKQARAAMLFRGCDFQFHRRRFHRCQLLVSGAQPFRRAACGKSGFGFLPVVGVECQRRCVTE